MTCDASNDGVLAQLQKSITCCIERARMIILMCCFECVCARMIILMCCFECVRI